VPAAQALVSSRSVAFCSRICEGLHLSTAPRIAAFGSATRRRSARARRRVAAQLLGQQRIGLAQQHDAEGSRDHQRQDSRARPDGADAQPDHAP